MTPAPPPQLEVDDARERIRADHRTTGRRIAVLDDDPTGSQSVHGVEAVLVPDPGAYAAALARPGSTCFVLTNSRSLAEADAVRVTGDAGREALALGRRLRAPVSVVSRSDSTLRGHVLAEVGALQAARREVLGQGYDAVLLVPAYLEAGRFTEGDTHFARVGGRAVPVGETEFARDATFGYRSSNLRDLLVELGRGRIARADVATLSLDDVRLGGPERVTEVLAGVDGGRFVVVNATRYADLEVVALGALAAERAGRALLYRTGPSFVRALAGIEPRPPLTAADVWPGGPPSGHGLVVVGSHVGLTTAQVGAALARGGLAPVTLDVAEVVDRVRRDGHVRRAAGQVRAALAADDVLLLTGRDVVTGPDGAASLRIARAVSSALTGVVRGALAAGPRWIVAKGGITSHDVAAGALGVRRAVVAGQLLPGMVSLFRPVEAAPEAIDVPYVVFAGNVGDERTLADVVDRMRGHGGGHAGSTSG